jgi:hypothetical protein
VETLSSENRAALDDEEPAKAQASIGDRADSPPQHKPTARTGTESSDDIRQVPSKADKSASATRGTVGRLVALGKRLSTLAIALVAILVALVTWQQYVTAPWTRDGTPAGVPLVSGMTATVTVRPAAETDHRGWLDRMRADVPDQLSDLFRGPVARPNCLPVFTPQRAPTESLPAESVPQAMSPEQINPGLAPGMVLSPRIR